MSKLNIVIDMSMMDTFQSCECKFNYRYNLRKTMLEKAKPLDRGSVIHKGEEAYWKVLQAKGPSGWDEASSIMVQTIREALVSDECNLTSDYGVHLIEFMQQNVEFWKPQDIEFEILYVEQPFSFVLHEDEQFRVVLIGKIDLLVNYQNYSNLVIDHKGYSSSRAISRFRNQFCCYSMAAGSMFLWANMIGDHLIHTAKPKPVDEKFKRLPLSFDPLFLEQWKQNTIKWALRYYDCVQANDWPMNLTSCDKYNRNCEYLPVCDTSGEENKLYKLNTDFATGEPWDVSKSLTYKSDD